MVVNVVYLNNLREMLFKTELPDVATSLSYGVITTCQVIYLTEPPIN